MSARERKRKAFEAKIRNTFLATGTIVVFVVVAYSAVSTGVSAFVTFMLDAVGWIIAAAAIVSAAALLAAGIKGEAPRVRSAGWAFVLLSLPFLAVYALDGTTSATRIQLYLFGNMCALFLLCISMTLGIFSPE